MIENDAPKGLKIISILYYVIGILMLLGGVIGIGVLLYYIQKITGGFSNFIDNFRLLFFFNPTINLLFVVIIALLITGSLFLFIGRGLKKKQKWSRIVAIILAFISILEGVDFLIYIFTTENSLSFTQYVIRFIPITFNLIVGGYLLFNKEVKEVFSNVKNTKNKPSNKKYIYIPLIMLIIIIYGFSSYNTIEKQQLPPELIYPETELPPEVKDCEQVFHNPDAMPFSDRDLCYYKLALKLENPNICSKIVSETFVDDCYNVLSQRMGDYRVCGLIKYDGWRGLCYLKYLDKMPIGIEFCKYLTYGDHEESCIAKFKEITP